jgi:hypothetical protein
MITDSVVIILIITFAEPKTSFTLSCYGIYMLSLFTGSKLVVGTAVNDDHNMAEVEIGMIVFC